MFEQLSITTMKCLVKLTIFLIIIGKGKSFTFYGVGTGYRYLANRIAEALNFRLDVDVKTNWLEVPVDHFNQSSKDWKMRYFHNLEYFEPGGPIYLFVGGEFESQPVFLVTGFMHELAKSTQGALFGSEHRFYGMSQPFNYTNLETLQFLHSRQVLADINKLIKHIKSRKDFKKSKVVLFGASYAGALAVWMKMLYPQQIQAVVASSAPVMAKVDFSEYLDQVTVDYKQLASHTCWNNVEVIFERYDGIFSRESAVKQLKEEENICKYVNMKLEKNKQLFFLDKITEFMLQAEIGDEFHINRHCNNLMKSSKNILSREIFDDKSLFWSEESSCYDYDFYNLIEKLKEIPWVTVWLYQSCTEFGFFQTTNSPFHPFTKNIPLELYLKICSAMFGRDFSLANIEEGVRKTNEQYGGTAPNVTNVIFVHGELDPWRRLGVTSNISSDCEVIALRKVSHCRDIFPSYSDDNKSVKDARKLIKNTLKKWLLTGHDRFPEAQKRRVREPRNDAKSRNDDESIDMEVHEINNNRKYEIHIRHCLLYDFDLGYNATDSCRRIHLVYGNEAISEQACQKWYERFLSGDRSFGDLSEAATPFMGKKAKFKITKILL